MTAETLKVGDLDLDLPAREVSGLPLTGMECVLLRAIMARPRSIEDLTGEVYPHPNREPGDPHSTIRTKIHQIRRKLRQAGLRTAIVFQSGRYTIRAEGESVEVRRFTPAVAALVDAYVESLPA